MGILSRNNSRPSILDRANAEAGASTPSSHHDSPVDPDYDREAAGAAASDARDAALRGDTEMAQRFQDQADRHRDIYLHPYSR
ncbi:hypothetical protein [Streptomyces capitiformicae]|uniref:Uncharacterized protein n=1 Tax=Streptomyces capitiformicae TaxID=2014920 RepID=A0A919GNF7_9ACTN|nr:hypothetical protein [Streptomyces capitiformicae]GHH87859.1 hypothetical protein GCM10017771_30770 [Streptomyces capitiformicae]